MSDRPQPLRYSVKSSDRIFLHSVEVRFKSADDDAFYVNELGSPLTVHPILFSEVPTLAGAGALSVERDYYSSAHAELKVQRRLAPLNDLADEKRRDLAFQYRCVIMVRSFVDKLPLNLSDRLQIALDEVYPRLRLENLSGDAPCSIAKKDRLPKSTWKDWNSALRRANDNPQALIDTRTGNSSARLPVEVEDLLQTAVYRYLKPGGGTQPIQQNWLKGEIDDINIGRAARGLKNYPVPCLKTLQRRCADVDKFIVLALQHGLEFAEKAYRETHDGLYSRRPGERMEVDGWYMDLHTLIDKKTWKHLSAEDQKKLKTIRVHVVVGIDTAARTINAIKFGWTEDEALIQAVLRQSIEDKTPIAKAIGCECSYEMRSYGIFIADNNPAFKTTDITWKTLKAMNTRQSSIPGMAWHRGRIERFFRTVIMRFVSLFLGQTGSNPKNRTRYQSQDYAIVTHKEVEALLLKWIVDVYHNEKHGGLDGMTPRQAYYLLSQIYPPNIPLTPKQISEIFGQEDRYRLGSAGLVINYTQYRSDQLEMLRKAIGDGTFVDVKIDYADLRQVLVKIPNRLQGRAEYRHEQWISVPHPQIEKRFSLRDLYEASSELAERFGFTFEASEQIQRAAMEVIERKIEEATANTLGEPPIDAAYVEAYKNKSVHELLRWGDPAFLAAQKAEVHTPFIIPQAPNQTSETAPSSSINFSIKD